MSRVTPQYLTQYHMTPTIMTVPGTTVLLEENTLLQTNSKQYIPCVDPESFVRGVPNLITFFLVDEEIEDPNITINGPSSARQ